jgi:hypothetical protein
MKFSNYSCNISGNNSYSSSNATEVSPCQVELYDRIRTRAKSAARRQLDTKSVARLQDGGAKATRNRRRIVEVTDSSSDNEDDDDVVIHANSRRQPNMADNIAANVSRVLLRNEQFHAKTSSFEASRSTSKTSPVCAASASASSASSSDYKLNVPKDASAGGGGVEVATFSLGFDGFDDDDVLDANENLVGSHSFGVDDAAAEENSATVCNDTFNKRPAQFTVDSVRLKTDNCVRMPSGIEINSTMNAARSNVSPANLTSVGGDTCLLLSQADKQREERLRLSRLKREEFQRKLAERRSSPPADPAAADSDSVMRRDTSVSTDCDSKLGGAKVETSPSTSSNVDGKQLCILVDSRELNGAQVNGRVVSVSRVNVWCISGV